MNSGGARLIRRVSQPNPLVLRRTKCQPESGSQVGCPELAALLRSQWRQDISWESLVELRDRLQCQLEDLRRRRGIVPPVIQRSASERDRLSRCPEGAAPIWTTKPETARRLKRRIKVVFDWAKASGHRSGDNPTEGLTKVLPRHRGEPKHHAALLYQAVPTFINVLRTADTSESIRLAFELLILTAMRVSAQRVTQRSKYACASSSVSKRIRKATTAIEATCLLRVNDLSPPSLHWICVGQSLINPFVEPSWEDDRPAG